MFKKKKKPENISDVLNYISTLEKRVEDLSKQIETIKEKDPSNLCNFSLIRFNPFADAGGNQSFCVAILDNKKNGVVITSLYSRDGNRVYGKTIKNGECEYDLLKEEQQAIKEALNG